MVEAAIRGVAAEIMGRYGKRVFAKRWAHGESIHEWWYVETDVDAGEDVYWVYVWGEWSIWRIRRIAWQEAVKIRGLCYLADLKHRRASGRW
jgi:hypothetical protein